MSEENISKMNFKQLRGEVQRLRDELARMKRSYEDILYNLDYENFGAKLVREKNNMKTSFKQSAEAIVLQAKKIDAMDVYYTSQFKITSGAIEAHTEAIKDNVTKIGELILTTDGLSASVTKVARDVAENEASIKVNAEAIEAEVTDRTNKDAILESRITQTAKEIKFAVDASYSSPEEINGEPSSAMDKGKMYHDVTSGLYWYYDGAEWCSTQNANFGTVFEQTAYGFSLKGDVSINGSTIISESSEDGDTVQIAKGHIYLMPGNSENAKMTMGFNRVDDNSAPFIQFGQGTGGSTSVAGMPTTPGTALMYKDSTSFSLGLYPSDSSETAQPLISFHDGGVSGMYDEGSFISFNSSVVDFTYATVNGFKITFG